jgi:hypothetical protein
MRRTHGGPTGPSPIRQISKTFPRAAKPHRCMICDEDIAKGDVHEKLVYYNGTLVPVPGIRCIRLHIRCTPSTGVHHV